MSARKCPICAGPKRPEQGWCSVCFRAVERYEPMTIMSESAMDRRVAFKAGARWAIKRARASARRKG